MNIDKNSYLKFEEFSKKHQQPSEFNEDLLSFIFYLCENQGMILATTMHELYHKYQFNTLKFLFILNQVLFTLIGYEFSTTCRYSIEGDVRIKVDNQFLYDKISLLYTILMGYSRKYKTVEEMQIQVTEENSHFFTFAESLFDYARTHKTK